jgi:hypothetical protein
MIEQNAVITTEVIDEHAVRSAVEGPDRGAVV